MADRGVVYYAAGKQYRDEARRSAASLNEQMDVPVTLFTDRQVDDPVFNEVREIEPDGHPFLDRIQYWADSPYDRTLYLDGDTYVCRPVPELFEMLDRFDIALSPASVRRRTELDDVPQSFPEFNAGVVTYRTSDEVLDMFATFEERYTAQLEEEYMVDQPAFREALYRSDLDIGVIPPEYNCRFGGPTFVDGEVKILHGRHPDMAAMAEAVNRETSKRVLTGDSDRRIFAEPKPMNVVPYPGPGRFRGYLSAIRRSLREDGLKETVQDMLDRAGRLV